jgi:hypothetical protein
MSNDEGMTSPSDHAQQYMAAARFIRQSSFVIRH